jgi:hypothetical protein
MYRQSRSAAHCSISSAVRSSNSTGNSATHRSLWIDPSNHHHAIKNKVGFGSTATTARRLCTTVGSRSQNRFHASSRRMAARIREPHKCRPISAKHSPTDSLPDVMKASFPHVAFTTNIYERNRHGKGESHHPTVALMWWSPCTEDIRMIVQHCVHHKIPIIPFWRWHVSGRTRECSYLRPSARHESLAIDRNSRHDRREPSGPNGDGGCGCHWKTLNQALATRECTPVDPGADATIGGMVATGLWDSCTYGTMRENILALECVLARCRGDGRPCRHARLEEFGWLIWSHSCG